jgi:hypothetical protein
MSNPFSKEAAEQFRKWCYRMRDEQFAGKPSQSPQEGQMRLGNLSLDCLQPPAQLPHERVREVFDRILPAGQQPWPPVTRMAREEEAGLRCLGAPFTDADVPQWCSAVMPISDYINTFRFGPKVSQGMTGQYNDEILANFARSAAARGQLFPSAPFVNKFTAHSDDIKVMQRAYPTNLQDRGVAIRDLLGLPVLKAERIIELRLPGNHVANGPKGLRRPTQLDATSNPLYRSYSGSGCWGRTVNLATGKDGAREAVHGIVPMPMSYEIDLQLATISNVLTIDELNIIVDRALASHPAKPPMNNDDFEKSFVNPMRQYLEQ